MQARLTIVGLTIAALIATSTNAQASVTLGATDADFASVSSGIACPTDPCELLQYTFPLGRVSTSASDGVLVRWRMRVEALIDAPDATANLRLIGPSASPLPWGAIGPPVEVPNMPQLPTTISQEVRIPIARGQGVAVQFQNLAGGVVFVAYKVVPGAVFAFVNGTPPVGGTADPIVGTDPSLVAIAADVEPDADRDGFGDETQDQCPGDPATQGVCPDTTAPETEIRKAPKKKSTKRMAKFTFTSTEPGSTFSCALDGIDEPCSSPFKQRISVGRHYFEVTAIDAAGNRDLAPANYKWKVKR